MSNTFTQKLKQRVITAIKSDLKFDTPDKFIEDLHAFAETLMTDEEKTITTFLRNGCIGFYGHFYSFCDAKSVAGHYFRDKKLIIPDRVLELEEFKDYVEGVKIKADEFMRTVAQIEYAVNCCNGFREFNQTLPQFKSYLEKAREELYGARNKTSKPSIAPVKISNLSEYLKE